VGRRCRRAAAIGRLVSVAAHKPKSSAGHSACPRAGLSPRRQRLHTRTVGRTLRVSASSSGLRRLIYLTYWGFTNTPHGLHHFAGQGIPARQRAGCPNSRLGCRRTRQNLMHQRLERGIAMEGPGVSTRWPLAGQSILINANAPQFRVDVRDCSRGVSPTGESVFFGDAIRPGCKPS